MFPQNAPTIGLNVFGAKLAIHLLHSLVPHGLPLLPAPAAETNSLGGVSIAHRLVAIEIGVLIAGAVCVYLLCSLCCARRPDTDCRCLSRETDKCLSKFEAESEDDEGLNSPRDAYVNVETIVQGSLDQYPLKQNR